MFELEVLKDSRTPILQMKFHKRPCALPFIFLSLTISVPIKCKVCTWLSKLPSAKRQKLVELLLASPSCEYLEIKGEQTFVCALSTHTLKGAFQTARQGNAVKEPHGHRHGLLRGNEIRPEKSISHDCQLVIIHSYGPQTDFTTSVSTKDLCWFEEKLISIKCECFL